MKFVALTLALMTSSVYAQGLSADFSCSAKSLMNEELSIEITNIDFAKEVVLKKKNKVCNYLIHTASYEPNSASNDMLFEFEQKESCKFADQYNPVKSGFIKVSFAKPEAKAYVLVLAGHDTLPCEIKSFNQKKLANRIRNSF